MSKKGTDTDGKIKGRIILAAQSTGRIGKSVTTETIAVFFDYAGIEYTITDADAEHHTISDRYEDAVRTTFNEPDDLLRIIKRAGKKVPVELIDVPAQKTDYILSTLERFDAFSIAAEANVRLTILLFVADDPAAEASLQKILQSCRTKVEYVIIKNLARFKSRHFEGSGMEKKFKAMNTPVVELPSLTQTTLDELSRAKAKLGRWLPLSEAATSETIDAYSRFEIQFFLNRAMAQWSDASRVLLPDGFEFTPFYEKKKPTESPFDDIQIEIPED